MLVGSQMIRCLEWNLSFSMSSILHELCNFLVRNHTYTCTELAHLYQYMYQIPWFIKTEKSSSWDKQQKQNEENINNKKLICHESTHIERSSSCENTLPCQNSANISHHYRLISNRLNNKTEADGFPPGQQPNCPIGKPYMKCKNKNCKTMQEDRNWFLELRLIRIVI